jgi:hypothetical protein
LSRDRRLEKLCSIRSSIKFSITDLSSELKEGLELARRAKAVLEAKERERTRTVECTSCFVSRSPEFPLKSANSQPRTI